MVAPYHYCREHHLHFASWDKFDTERERFVTYKRPVQSHDLLCAWQTFKAYVQTSLSSNCETSPRGVVLSVSTYTECDVAFYQLHHGPTLLLQRPRMNFENLPEHLRSHPAVIAEAIALDPQCLQHVPTMQRTKAVVVSALAWRYAVLYATWDVSKDKEFAICAVSSNPNCLLLKKTSVWPFKLSELDEQDVILEAVSNMQWYHSADLIIPSVLFQDETFMRKAVLKNNLILANAPITLRRDETLVCDALRRGNISFATIEPALRSRTSVVEAALQGRISDLLRFCRSLFDNTDVVMACVAINGHQLQYASERLRKNAACVRTAMLQNVHSLLHMHYDLKHNKAFMLQCVSEDARALRFASPALINDLEVLRTSLYKMPYSHVL